MRLASKMEINRHEWKQYFLTNEFIYYLYITESSLPMVLHGASNTVPALEFESSSHLQMSHVELNSKISALFMNRDRIYFSILPFRR